MMCIAWLDNNDHGQGDTFRLPEQRSGEGNTQRLVMREEVKMSRVEKIRTREWGVVCVFGSLGGNLG